MNDPHNLTRFVKVQDPVYRQVRRELAAGRKTSHWMWFVFPQLKGLGFSAMAQNYGIASVAEAEAYLRHPILGARLRECVDAVNRIEGDSAFQIFGTPDDLKFRSCLTLFHLAAPDDPVFREALEKYFGGAGDPRTMAKQPRRKFTRDDVRRMIDAGVLEGNRIELTEGDLIDKRGHNPPHACAVSVVLTWLASLFGIGFVRCQLSIEASAGDRERSEPEPDLVVLREAVSGFWSRHPRGNELVLAVEVSDSSLTLDRTVKAGLYARAGVPEYWVVDLRGRAVFVHRNSLGGVYTEVLRVAEQESVSPNGLETHAVLVSDLLPPSETLQ